MNLIKFGVALALAAASAAQARYVTEDKTSHSYSKPLGATYADVEVDRSKDVTGRARSYDNVQIKPGVVVPFAWKHLAQAPTPTRTPPPPPAPTTTPTSGDVLFKTTFDIPVWKQGGGSDPLPADDAIRHYGDWTAGGHGDEITADANYPAGGGGNGFRHYRGVGRNANGGGLKITMPKPLTEMWVRQCMRFSQGFAWSGGQPSYTKDHYWNVGGSNFLIFGHQGGAWGLHTATGSVNIPSFVRWADTEDGAVASGKKWNCFEYHVKQDGANGMVEMWVNGKRALTRTLNLGSTPWSYLAIGENQSNVIVGGYTDYDDFAVSNTGRIGP